MGTLDYRYRRRIRAGMPCARQACFGVGRRLLEVAMMPARMLVRHFGATLRVARGGVVRSLVAFLAQDYYYAFLSLLLTMVAAARTIYFRQFLACRQRQLADYHLYGHFS